jgi:hypothetical protein
MCKESLILLSLKDFFAENLGFIQFNPLKPNEREREKRKWEE